MLRKSCICFPTIVSASKIQIFDIENIRLQMKDGEKNQSSTCISIGEKTLQTGLEIAFDVAFH